jgi:hypothetical protein
MDDVSLIRNFIVCLLTNMCVMVSAFSYCSGRCEGRTFEANSIVFTVYISHYMLEYVRVYVFRCFWVWGEVYI